MNTAVIRAGNYVPVTAGAGMLADSICTEAQGVA